MYHHLKKKMTNKDGFTLVEIMVVGIILVILVTTALLSISGYMSNERFRRNEDYAKSIYVSAQTALTHLKTSGQLERFAEEVKSGDGEHDDSGQLNDSMVNGISEYGGRVYYLRKDSGAIDSESLLYELLDPYIFDYSILESAICIELDPSEGVVYSVFYSDYSTSLKYSGEEFSESSASLTNRDKSDRRPVYLGYWGIDELTAAAPSSLGKPVISDVTLINSETLTLRWQMSEKYKKLSNTFTYSLYIYDKAADSEKDSPLMTITLPAGSASKELVKSAVVKIKQADGTETVYSEETKNAFGFLYYIDSDNSIKLILDAIDTEGKCSEKSGDLANTLSFARFGIEPDGIYVRIQASGVGYKNSVWRQSNTENPFFADCTSASIEKEGFEKYYSLKNSRHLYNIRHMENGITAPESESTPHQYVQTATFSWQDAIVYKLGVTPTVSDDAAVSFPPIPKLNSGSELKRQTSWTGIIVKYQLKSFVINGEKDIGLFAENHGTISGLIVFEPSVSGKENVGSVCAVNYGTLDGITVSGGSVSGDKNVGGIAGLDGKDIESVRRYNSLTNSARVEGNYCVGGIIGRVFGTRIKEDKDYLPEEIADRTSVIKCENTGKILGGEVSLYIGGITGLNSDAVLSGCVGSPLYNKNELTISKANLNAMLNGTCVGGIVGCNSAEGILENCSTGSGWLLGGRYVGGIVGLQKVGDEPVTLDGTIDEGNKSSANAANVVGREYVGGIVGAVVSAEIDEEKKTVAFDENTQTADKLIITGWKNTGIVAATEGCGGGIAGYNAGTIQKCSTDIDKRVYNDDQIASITLELCSEADYIGGIAGKNAGIINCDDGTLTGSKAGVKAILTGRDYVGGIVGLNLQVGELTGGKLGGGRITGRNFVGGIAGANLSEKLFKAELSANPASVSGDCYIGGIVGANIISEEPKSENVILVKAVLGQKNNALGTITGSRAFVGGFFGYNCIIEAEKNNNTFNGLTVLENLSAAALKTDLTGLYNAVDSASKDGAGKLHTSKASIIIGGENEGNEEKYISGISKISAKLCVGGVMGFNDADSVLTIENISNCTVVAASDSITSNEEKYSYVGGIIGKNTLHSTIKNCENGRGAQITSNGDYTGGLIEYNDGIVTDCTASNLGSALVNNVGGIVGFNSSEGRIYSCSLNGAAITGAKNVGGICSVNNGEISSEVKNEKGEIVAFELDGTIYGTGDNVGAVAGINNGEITYAKISGASVTGAGKYTGGVVGTNNGTVKNCSTTNKSLIGGGSVVGGIVGLQLGDPGNLEALVNNANVSCDTGSAGGIIGELNNEKLSNGWKPLSGCVNYGKVEAKKGDAGGITALVAKDIFIKDCDGSGVVKALAGKAGAVAAVNYGSIIDCFAGKNVKANFTVSALGIIGGIAAENYGTLDGCINYYAKVQSSSESTGKITVGGIVGANYNEVTNCSTEDTAGVMCLISGSTVGGIVGTNYGKNDGVTGVISGTSYDKAFCSAVITDDSRKYTGSFGGICGDNRGEIDGYKFTGKLYAGNGQDGGGYGGIAGVNTGTIKSCETSALIWVKGTNGSVACAGGIAGVNGSTKNTDAKISNCILSKSVLRSGDDSNSGNAFMGGIVGDNFAVIENCTFAHAVDESGKVLGYSASGIKLTHSNGKAVGTNDTELMAADYTITVATGHVGGIVGQNEQSGEITECETGKGWLIWQRALLTDNTAGGIIGRSITDKDVTGCVNYSHVYKMASGSNSAGGIVGRIENNMSSGWSYVRCINKGNVIGIDRIGGVVGQLKSKGGTFTDCENYGDIYTQSYSVGSGGIIAALYQIQAGETVNITGCANYGKINNGSGIIDGVHKNCANDMIIRVINCVNTGTVGKSGIAKGESNHIYQVENCRNYGYYKNYGIIKSDNINKTDSFVKYCLNAYKNSNFISTTDVMKNTCFYFSGENIDSVKIIGANVDGVTDSSKYINLFNGTGLNWNVNGSECDIRVVFSQPYPIDKISLVAGADSAAFTYDVYPLDNIGGTGEPCVKDQSPNASGSEISFDSKTARGVIIRIYPTNGTTDTGTQTTAAKISIKKLTVAGIIAYSLSTDTKLRTDTLLQPLLTTTYDGKLCAMDRYGKLWFEDIRQTPNTTNYKALEDTDGKSLYRYIDDQMKFYADSVFYAAAEGSPQNLSFVEDVGGAYKLEWKGVDGASSYKLTAVSENYTGSWYSEVINSIRWRIPEDLYGKLVDFTVYAVRTKANGDTKEVLSEPSGTLTLAVRVPLPIPEAHIEMLKIGETGLAMSAQITNKEDYVDKSCNINIKVETFYNVTFGSEKGYLIIDSKGSDSNSDTPFTSQALSDVSPTNLDLSYKYGNSARTSYQSIILSSSYFKEKKLISSTVWNGFLGITPSTLKYSASLKPDSFELFYRTELLIPNYNGFSSLVVSSSVQRVSGSDSNKPLTSVELGNLPYDMVQNAQITVRTYPWNMQNDAQRFYHLVGGVNNITGLTDDELLEKLLTLDELTRLQTDGSMLNENDTTLGKNMVVTVGSDDSGNATYTVAKGYIVEYLPVNRDSRVYDRYRVYYSVCVDNDSQVKSTEVDIAAKRQTAPVLLNDASGNGYRETDSAYVFLWDVKDGIKTWNDVSTIDYASLKKDSNAKYSVIVTGIPAKNSANAETADSVIIYSADSTADNFVTLTKFNWNFSRITIRITALGSYGTDGVLASKLPGITECAIDIRVPLTTIPTPQVALNDKNDLVYNITWTPIGSEKELVENHTILVCYESEVNGEKIQTELPFPTEGWSESMTAPIDLGDIAPSTELKIYVIANPTETASAIYTSSARGTPYILTLPTRLNKPLSSLIKLSYSYNSTPPDNSIIAEAFTSGGLCVNIVNTLAQTSADGKYELEYRIYESYPTAMTAGSDDSIYNPVGELSRLTMQGTLSSSSYAFTADTMSAEYAGYYLRARIRCVSDSQVSSSWSDYAVLRLPKLRLAKPLLSYSQLGISGVRGSINPYTAEVKPQPYTLSTDTLTFSPVIGADYYIIKVGTTEYRLNAVTGLLTTGVADDSADALRIWEYKDSYANSYATCYEIPGQSAVVTPMAITLRLRNVQNPESETYTGWYVTAPNVSVTACPNDLTLRDSSETAEWTADSVHTATTPPQKRLPMCFASNPTWEANVCKFNITPKYPLTPSETLAFTGYTVTVKGQTSGKQTTFPVAEVATFDAEGFQSGETLTIELTMNSNGAYGYAGSYTLYITTTVPAASTASP